MPILEELIDSNSVPTTHQEERTLAICKIELALSSLLDYSHGKMGVL